MLREMSLLPNLSKNYGGQRSQHASLGGYTDFETYHIVTLLMMGDLRLFTMAPEVHHCNSRTSLA